VSKWVHQGIFTNVFQYAALALNFVFYTLLIRAIGPEMYGYFAYLLSALQLVLVVFSFGISIKAVRFEGSEDRFRDLFYLFEIGLAISLIVPSALFAHSFVGPTILGVSLAVLGMFSTWVQSIGFFWQWKNQYPHYNAYVLAFAAGKALLAGLIDFEFIQRQQGFIALSALSVAAVLVLHISVGIPRFSGGLKNLFTVLRQQADKSIWSSQISLFVYTKADVLMLPLLGVAMVEVGQYSYVYAFFSAALLFPVNIQNVLLRPLYSRELQGRSVWEKASHLYFVLGLIVSLGFAYGLPLVFTLIFGPAENLQDFALVLSPALAMVFIANLFGLALLVEGREGFRAKCHWATAVLNIALNVLLIPKWGALGAAFATSLSYFALYILFLFGVGRGQVWDISRFPGRLVLQFFTFLALILWQTRFLLG